MSPAPTAAPSLLVDHLILLVPDLPAAEDALEDAGFTLGRSGAHPALGTRNRLVMLEGAYLELLAVARPTDANAAYRELLAAQGGAVGLALHSTDVNATSAVLARAGLSHGECLDVARPLADDALEPGTGTVPVPPASARFRLLPVPAEIAPTDFAFYCEHRTPELVWEDPPAHPNGARALLAIGHARASTPLSSIRDVESRVSKNALGDRTGTAPLRGQCRPARVEISTLPRGAKPVLVFGATTNRRLELSAAPAAIQLACPVPGRALLAEVPRD